MLIRLYSPAPGIVTVIHNGEDMNPGDPVTTPVELEVLLMALWAGGDIDDDELRLLSEEGKVYL